MKSNVGLVKTDVDNMRVFTGAYQDTAKDMTVCKVCLTGMKTQTALLKTSTNIMTFLPYIGSIAKVAYRALDIFEKLLILQITVVTKVEIALKRGKTTVAKVDGQLERVQKAIKKAEDAIALIMKRVNKIDTVTAAMAPAAAWAGDKGAVRASAVYMAKTGAAVCTVAKGVTSTDIKACTCARGAVQVVKDKVETARSGIETYRKIVCATTVKQVLKVLYDMFWPFIKALTQEICIPGFRRRLTTMDEHFAMIEDPNRDLSKPDEMQPQSALLSRLGRDRKLFGGTISDAGKAVGGAASYAGGAVAGAASGAANAAGSALSSAASAIGSLPSAISGLFPGGCFTIQDVYDKTLGAAAALVDKAIDAFLKALGVKLPNIPGLNIDDFGIPIGWVEGMDAFDFSALKPETLFSGMPAQTAKDMTEDEIWSAFSRRRQLTEAPVKPRKLSWIQKAKDVWMNNRRLAATDGCFGGETAKKLANGAAGPASLVITAGISALYAVYALV